MFTVIDPATGEFLCWSPETEMFFFSTSRTVIKADKPTILYYLQCATEGYPEVIGDRQVELRRVELTPEPFHDRKSYVIGDKIEWKSPLNMATYFGRVVSVSDKEVEVEYREWSRGKPSEKTFRRKHRIDEETRRFVRVQNEGGR